MAIYGNFEGTLKNEFKIGKQGAAIKRSETDNSLTLSNSDNTDLVNLNAKEATFNGTGAVKLPSGTTTEQPVPADGMIRYNSETGFFEIYSLGLWRELAYNTSPYDLAFFMPGPQPYPDIILGATLITEDVLIPSSCGVTGAVAKIPALASTSYDVQVNGNSIGSVSFDAGITIGVVDITETELVQGDLVELINPSIPDSDIADIMITISGVVTVVLCPVIAPPEPPLTWGPLPDGLDSTDSNPTFGVASTDKQGVWVALGSSGHASRTIDDGASWSTLVKGLNSGSTNAQFSSIATNENGTWVAVSTDSGYCSRSTDNGLTWVALPKGLIDGNSNNVESVATDGSTWMAVGGYGFSAKSIDDGLTWVALPPGLNTGNTSAWFDGIATDNAGTWVTAGEEGYASMSNDSGVSWNALTKGLNSGSTEPFFTEVSTDNAGTWVAVTDEGYASISTDNGVVWSALPKDLNSGTVDALFISVDTDNAGNWVAVAQDGYVSISTDNGVNWVQLLPRGLNSGNTTANFLSVSTNSAGVWMAFAGSALNSISPPLV